MILSYLLLLCSFELFPKTNLSPLLTVYARSQNPYEGKWKLFKRTSPPENSYRWKYATGSCLPLTLTLVIQLFNAVSAYQKTVQDKKKKPTSQGNYSPLNSLPLMISPLLLSWPLTSSSCSSSCSWPPRSPRPPWPPDLRTSSPSPFLLTLLFFRCSQTFFRYAYPPFRTY